MTIRPLVSVFLFYRNGFRSMTWGRVLWVIVCVKLFVIFFIIRCFFLQPAMEGKTDEEKQEIVGDHLSGYANRPSDALSAAGESE